MKRRDFTKQIGAAAFISAVGAIPSRLSGQTQPDVASVPAAPATAPLPQVGMLLFPDLTLLDLIGPLTALSRLTDIHLVWKTRDLVVSDSGTAVQPTITLDECPADLDVLFVPGGGGMIPVMRDAQVMAFVKDRGARAKYVTSVCSGSMILGAAGLLRGYKATSHWTVTDMLPLFGAEYVEGRVVIDRNRMTGGGVTAGIDFGLVIVAQLFGEEAAKRKQLALEYDPQPPFNAGSPRTAGRALADQIRAGLEPLNRQIPDLARRAAASW